MATIPDLTVIHAELSFRDYVAAHCMAATLTTASGLGQYDAKDLRDILLPAARICYAAADALIEVNSAP